MAKQIKPPVIFEIPIREDRNFDRVVRDYYFLERPLSEKNLQANIDVALQNFPDAIPTRDMILVPSENRLYLHYKPD